MDVAWTIITDWMYEAHSSLSTPGIPFSHSLMVSQNTLLLELAVSFWRAFHEVGEIPAYLILKHPLEVMFRSVS